MHPLRWLLAALPLAASVSGQTCYWPSGSVASALLPCSVASGNEAAACCFQNHYCMTNGLCLSPTEGTWYRGACTDNGFQKSGCPQICDKSGVLGATPDRHAAVWACASRSFACGSLGNCATQNFTVGHYRAVMNLALQTDLENSATETSSSTSSSTWAESTTTSSTGETGGETCPSTPQIRMGVSTGAAVGICVGVGLPLVIAVAALTAMLLREKKRNREAVQGQQQAQWYSTASPSPWGKPETGHFVEVSGQPAVMSELPTTAHGRQELPQ